MNDRCRRHAVHADQRRQFDGQFAHEMVRRGFAGVVGHRTFLGYDGIGAGGEHQTAGQALFLPNLRGFVSDDVTAGDVNAEGEVPFVVGDVAAGVGREKDAGGDDDGVEPAVGERHLVEHRADAGAVGDVAREADGWTAI